MIERTVFRDVDGCSQKGRKKKKFDENSPQHERMRKNNQWYDHRVNYVKIKRYLRSRVGDKWDDVYSDISHKYPEWKEAVKSQWVVATRLSRFENGIAYQDSVWRWWEKDWKIDGFYVLDGILCYQGR